MRLHGLVISDDFVTLHAAPWIRIVRTGVRSKRENSSHFVNLNIKYVLKSDLKQTAKEFRKDNLLFLRWKLIVSP